MTSKFAKTVAASILGIGLMVGPVVAQEGVSRSDTTRQESRDDRSFDLGWLGLLGLAGLLGLRRRHDNRHDTRTEHR